MRRAIAAVLVRLLDGPHRLLFLFAALSGMAGACSWLWLPAGVDPVVLHVGLFLGGMAQAAVCGYVLTALPGWTGTAHFGRGMSILCAVLWLLGVVALFVPVFAASLASASLAALVTLCVFFRFLRSGKWSRAGVIPFLLLLAAGWAGLASGAIPPFRPSPRETVLVLAALIGMVGGRALPAFARFWTPCGGETRTGLASMPGILLVAVAADLGLAGFPQGEGLALCFAGLAFLGQCAGWQWRTALSYPALLILFLSWLWLPAGLVAAGASLALPGLGLAFADALHVLTAGAISTMIYGFMARPAMRREAGRLRLGTRLATGYALLSLGAVARVGLPVVAPSLPGSATAALLAASGWLLFLSAYLPALALAAPRPVFSATHPGRAAV